MTIQILHYEFLGPIKLEEWGPPMEKVVYIILSRDNEKFHLVYAGECEKTEDLGFFTQNPNFKCWLSKGGSEKFLYLAILPLFDSTPEERKNILRKIISQYNPPCNENEIIETPYEVKPTNPEPEPEPEPKQNNESQSDTNLQNELCPCCGGKMELEKTLEKIFVIKCSKCGITDTRLKS